VETAFLFEQIINCLSDDLLHKNYSKNRTSKLAGHCYIASEAAYHLLGGATYWKPQFIKHEGSAHWFLLHKYTGEIVDITAAQFKSPIPYHNAKGKGFLTKKPCKRTQILLKRYYASRIRNN